jgi:hypothetical protein
MKIRVSVDITDDADDASHRTQRHMSRSLEFVLPEQIASSDIAEFEKAMHRLTQHLRGEKYTGVQSAAKDQALQKSCVLREAFQFFLDTFEYALVAEQPQTFPRKLPVGADRKSSGRQRSEGGFVWNGALRRTSLRASQSDRHLSCSRIVMGDNPFTNRVRVAPRD